MFPILHSAAYTLAIPPFVNFACNFCRLVIFFQNQLFQKFLSGISSEYQTVCIQIRPDISSGLIWVQTVSKGYQTTALVGKN